MSPLSSPFPDRNPTRPGTAAAASPLAGHARPESTLTPVKDATLEGPFRARRRPLYEGGPAVSMAGFGCYRIGLDRNYGFPECGLALERALEKGVNLIDTSTNYADGQSELLIGRTLRRLVEEKQTLERNKVVVVSKVGYVQGANMGLAMARELEGRPFPRMTKFGSDVWHCLHPTFIEDQVERSLARLSLATLDVCLLHNPEYYLKHLEIRGATAAAARAEFLGVLKESFETLERLCDEGRVRAYGVSSNTLGLLASEFTSVSLRDLLAVAQAVRPGAHRFRVVQMPLNWIESHPALVPFDDAGQTLLQLAVQEGIGVLVNRPFNAMAGGGGGLVRLTRPTMDESEAKSYGRDALESFRTWQRLSVDFETLAKSHVDTPGYEDASLSRIVVASLAWLPGVTSVLCGMKRVAYVDDVEDALRLPALVRARQLLAQIYDNLEFHAPLKQT